MRYLPFFLVVILLSSLLISSKSRKKKQKRVQQSEQMQIDDNEPHTTDLPQDDIEPVTEQPVGPLSHKGKRKLKKNKDPSVEKPLETLSTTTVPIETKDANNGPAPPPDVLTEGPDSKTKAFPSIGRLVFIIVSIALALAVIALIGWLVYEHVIMQALVAEESHFM